MYSVSPSNLFLLLKKHKEKVEENKAWMIDDLDEESR
jgi:hypothetical protein